MLLLSPPGTCRAFTRSGSSYPPLGLCQLAATVPDSACHVMDADGEGWNDERTLSEIRRIVPRMVGLSATVGTVALVDRWSRALSETGCTVVVGGPQASLDPEGVLAACPAVGAVVRGEAESIFPALVAGNLDQPGVMRRGGTAEILRVEAFDGLPFPRLDGLPIARYGCPDARRRPMVTMMTARGCPHRCGFCSSPDLLGRKVRGWSVGQVVAELGRIATFAREVSFVDDVFTVNRNRASAICAGMVGMDLSWFCNARADQVSTDLARSMALAGCHQVYLGFESGSPEILTTIAKGATLQQLERGASVLAEAGIGRSVGFVIGLPGETDATVDASIALAHRVRPERIQFTRWTPLPGTPLSRSHPGGPSGFHLGADDQVGRWIRRCYEACAGREWGFESW